MPGEEGRLERGAKVRRFEQMRREYEHGVGTILGVAKKFGVHRRMVRDALKRAVPPERKRSPRRRPKLGGAFADHFQMSPYDYLTKTRLDRARRALLSGDPAFRTVTAVAVDHGFSHLGRFSRDYREAFGELPRETLARS